MFNNIGKKVQKLAKVLCWLGIIMSVLIGLLMIYSGGTISTINVNGSTVVGAAGTVTGVLTIIIGSLCSWISSWVTYAIGEAAEYAEKHMHD